MPPAIESLCRCPWAAKGNERMQRYHDLEWGVPIHDDARQFEFLVLETAQAGLSWSVVLNKRDAYRTAFAGFQADKVARFTAARVEKLLLNPGIIRNRAKIAAAISNARAFLDIQEEFGSFDTFIWEFVKGRPRQNSWRTDKQVPARSRESDALSRALKERGFKFVGSTVCYAHMQAVGMINDHLVSCFRHVECRRARSAT